MFVELLLGVLLAAGLALCVWCLIGWFLLPFGRSGSATILLHVQEEADGLEQELRTLSWLRGSGLLRAKIVIVDCGLNEDGRALALRLARENRAAFQQEKEPKTKE